MLKAIASNVPDVLLIAGASSVAFGAWLIYQPAGFIVGGFEMLAIGFMAARSSK